MLSVNVEKRSLTDGQKAMFRACDLARQGKRVAGRWKRGALDNGESSDISDGYLYAMKRAGFVLDVAARAAALGDQYADYAGLPASVKAGVRTLDAAYRMAENYETEAA